jgi:hypothetical protein
VKRTCATPSALRLTAMVNISLAVGPPDLGMPREVQEPERGARATLQPHYHSAVLPCAPGCYMFLHNSLRINDL